MLIYYERSSFKEKHHIKGQPPRKIRVTVDQNVTYRDYDVEKSREITVVSYSVTEKSS